ncbi:MAG: RHS repeat-associated core domain-containing protein, partial [Pirellulales bacterium]|nr:RHS repeat-associated core domain-containing protein [Pirellulales bacterium]
PAQVDLLLGHAGGQFDAETGLIKRGMRYYDANTGRFLSEDPAEADVNPYRYAGNSPVNYVDPTGLYSISGNSLSSYGYQDFSAARSIINSTVGSPFSSSYSGVNYNSLLNSGSSISPSSYGGSQSFVSSLPGLSDRDLLQSSLDASMRQSMLSSASSRSLYDFDRPTQALPLSTGTDSAEIVRILTMAPRPINDPINRFIGGALEGIFGSGDRAVMKYNEVRGQGGSLFGSLYTGIGSSIGGLIGVENIENARSGRDAAGNQLGPVRRTFETGLALLNLIPVGKGVSIGVSQFFGREAVGRSWPGRS